MVQERRQLSKRRRSAGLALWLCAWSSAALAQEDGRRAAEAQIAPCPHCPNSTAVAHAAGGGLGEVFVRAADPAGFPPRWECGTWSSALGWLHILSDLGIWLAYLAIPFALAYFIRRRRDMPFPFLFWLFCAFIVACGTNHLMEAAIFWWPVYRLAGLLKLVTALVSWTTVLAILPVIPKALSLRSPEYLAHEIAQHTRELRENGAQLARVNQELAEAKAAAETATQSKSLFLAHMSHEIRTPMTAILGYAEELLDPALAEPHRRDAANTILRNGQHLLQVINDILDLSKIEAGKMTVERVTCAPREIIAEVLDLMRARAATKNLPLYFEAIGPLPETIQTDPTRLRQILINLLGNAIKFTETGGIRLVARLAREEDGRARLQFDVLDTGIGMTPEQMTRLFQPFTQADTSMSRQFGGTGLGLTISRQFARMLGGDVWIVETNNGAGTRFRATFDTGPLDGVRLLESLTATDPMAAPKMPPAAANFALPPCRILLAEDGPDNQRLISHILQKAGATVKLAENGQLAVEAAFAERAAGRSFDVILMDMQMPVLDGYQATEQLRRHGYTGPIIALTAHAMTTDRDKCLRCGCDEYVTKPVNRQQLLHVIQAHLSTAATAGAGSFFA